MTISEWKEISEAFYNFSLGSAAIVGILAGLKIAVPALKRWYKIRRFRKHYPNQSHSKTWELIRLQDTSPVYVHHLQSNTRRHVVNPETMADLGLDWNSIRLVSREELDKFELGDPINTQK
jgi:hypothetical protein